MDEGDFESEGLLAMTGHPSNRRPLSAAERLENIKDALFESELLEAEFDAVTVEQADIEFRAALAQAQAAAKRALFLRRTRAALVQALRESESDPAFAERARWRLSRMIRTAIAQPLAVSAHPAPPTSDRKHLAKLRDIMKNALAERESKFDAVTAERVGKVLRAALAQALAVSADFRRKKVKDSPPPGTRYSKKRPNSSDSGPPKKR